MRLWHYKLIEYLPKSQLLAQWRELNSIFKKQDRHILINYIYDYSPNELMSYAALVIQEMRRRGFKVNKENYDEYFGHFYADDEYPAKVDKPFNRHHNKRYLMQCFCNLQEKFDRGQKDFSKTMYLNLRKFVIEEMLNQEVK